MPKMNRIRRRGLDGFIACLLGLAKAHAHLLSYFPRAAALGAHAGHHRRHHAGHHAGDGAGGDERGQASRCCSQGNCEDVFPNAGVGVFFAHVFPPSISRRYTPGFFLILAALIQFLSSKMMQPVVSQAQKEAAKTEGKTDDMATAMQSQMLYLFPLMTIFIGYSFPSGLILYWFVFSLFTAIQQYFISGWGGLNPWINKLSSWKK